MVYVLLANGFEETELIAPMDILRRGGVDVKLVGVDGLQAESTRGIKIAADIQLPDLIMYDMEMLVLPGGQPGVDNLWADERVKSLVKGASVMGSTVGAICAAPMILGRLGLLEGKKAICYPGCEADLKGAEICTGAKVVRDGNIITAKGAGCALEFGFELLSAIKGKDVAEKVAADIQYSRA